MVPVGVVITIMMGPPFFLAVLNLIRELYLDKLRTPEAYASSPQAAVTLFCGRFPQLLVCEPQVRTSRLIIAEAERLPEAADAYYDVVARHVPG
jgi:hypothetical protein